MNLFIQEHEDFLTVKFLGDVPPPVDCFFEGRINLFLQGFILGVAMGVHCFLCPYIFDEVVLGLGKTRYPQRLIDVLEDI